MKGWNEEFERVEKHVFSLETRQLSSESTWKRQELLHRESCFSAATTTAQGDIVFTGSNKHSFALVVVIEETF